MKNDSGEARSTGCVMSDSLRRHWVKSLVTGVCIGLMVNLCLLHYLERPAAAGGPAPQIGFGLDLTGDPITAIGNMSMPDGRTLFETPEAGVLEWLDATTWLVQHSFGRPRTQNDHLFDAVLEEHAAGAEGYILTEYGEWTPFVVQEFQEIPSNAGYIMLCQKLGLTPTPTFFATLEMAPTENTDGYLLDVVLLDMFVHGGELGQFQAMPLGADDGNEQAGVRFGVGTRGWVVPAAVAVVIIIVVCTLFRGCRKKFWGEFVPSIFGKGVTTNSPSVTIDGSDNTTVNINTGTTVTNNLIIVIPESSSGTPAVRPLQQAPNEPLLHMLGLYLGYLQALEECASRFGGSGSGYNSCITCAAEILDSLLRSGDVPEVTVDVFASCWD